MLTVLRLTLFAFSVLFCMLESTVISDDSGHSKDAEAAARQSRHLKVFVELRQMFPNPILDEDFKTLKQVTRSKVYLAYLKSEFPTDEPFETLEEFINIASPPVERYRDFLNKHFKNLTEADFLGIHQLTLLKRRTNMMHLASEKTGNERYLRAAVQLGAFGLMPDHLRQKLEKINSRTIWSFRLRRGHARRWWRSRFQNYAEDYKFTLSVMQFAVETQKADTDWIQTQFETYG